MPKIDTTINDLHHLIGRPITISELDEALSFAKGEVDFHDPKSGEVRISLEDTNQPYLWSAEGIAILLRGVLGMESGLPRIKIETSKSEVIVDQSVKAIRPHIAVFCAKGPGVSDAFLRQLIQFQEKFCDAYGMKRSKVSIGMYRYDKVRFPVTYKAVAPEAIRFAPLGFTKQMTPKQILLEHPTGVAYSKLLEGLKAYPMLIDADNHVLSLIPIINSNDSGKVEVGDKELMFECTGTDEASVDLCANIFAHSLSIRGFSISACIICNGKNRSVKPSLECRETRLDVKFVNSMIGTKFEAKDIKELLEKCRHEVRIKTPSSLLVNVPSYRRDVLHQVDLVEDVAIMADYNSLPFHPLTSYTVGDINPIEVTIDSVRQVLSGLGIQEVLSAALSNKELLYQKAGCKDPGTVEITEFMNPAYSCVRSWLLPILIEVLSKNLHRDYPQNIFETGGICVRSGEHVLDINHCSSLLCSPDADYTKIRQALDCILAMIGAEPVTYEPLSEKDTHHGWMCAAFIPGRSAVCRVRGREVAVLGEINPGVLDRFEIRMPVAGMELDVDVLHELKQSEP